VAIIGFLWISYNEQIRSKTQELAFIQQEVSKYAKFELELQQLTKREELVDRKRQVIKDLQNDRDAVVRMLALLSIQIPPEKMWFDKLTQTANTVTLDGVAQSNEAIVEFMRNLESSPYIEKGSINLVLSKQYPVREMKLREFQLSYRFYPFSEVQKKLKM
jgi:type IV pilus assembly protein PilN